MRVAFILFSLILLVLRDNFDKSLKGFRLDLVEDFVSQNLSEVKYHFKESNGISNGHGLLL